MTKVLMFGLPLAAMAAGLFVLMFRGTSLSASVTTARLPKPRAPIWADDCGLFGHNFHFARFSCNRPVTVGPSASVTTVANDPGHSAPHLVR